MKTSFQDKINQCQLATKAQIQYLKNYKSKIEESLVLILFFPITIFNFNFKTKYHDCN